jgi:hypothetical protein
MSVRVAIRRLAALAIAAFPLFTFAADPVGRPSGGGSAIEWVSSISGHSEIRLTVLAPDGTLFTKTYPAGRLLNFSVQDLGRDFKDGQYNYELIVVPRITGQVKQ